METNLEQTLMSEVDFFNAVVIKQITKYELMQYHLGIEKLNELETALDYGNDYDYYLLKRFYKTDEGFVLAYFYGDLKLRKQFFVSK